mgnify:CR=1 FL=1
MPMSAGTSGGTSGLRYNPRETAGDELGYGVASTKYNPRDPDEKQTETDEKRAVKEKREHAKAGLQHIKLKVKNKKREIQEAQKETGELSDLTGPVGSRGGDLDQAIGVMSGTGSAMGGGVGAVPPELPGTGAFGQGGAFVRAFAVLKREDTETIESVRAKQRGVKAARTGRMKTTESVRSGRGKKSGKPLRVHFVNPMRRARQHPHQRVSGHPDSGAIQPRVVSHLYRGGSRTRPHIGLDPRAREQRIRGQQRLRYQPSTPTVAPIPFQTGHEGGGVKLRRSTQSPGIKQVRAPRQPSTPGGANKSVGASSPLAMSTDILDISDLILKLFGSKSKRQFSQADLAEFKNMFREVKRLLQGLKKSDKPKGDDGEKPSPNAHRRQTSHPRGPTEVDPDDDPTMWGTHPYGHLVARRGQG